MFQIKIECEVCSGTGLHVGWGEPASTATICTQCNGRGWYFLTYTPYDKRHTKPGIKKVYMSLGRQLPDGTVNEDPIVSYKEFLEKVPE